MVLNNMLNKCVLKGGVRYAVGTRANEMLKAIRQARWVKDDALHCATRCAKRVPKNDLTCSMIFNCIHQNAYDTKKPHSLQSPKGEKIGEHISFGNVN